MEDKQVQVMDFPIKSCSTETPVSGELFCLHFMISMDNWKILEQSNKHNIWEKLALQGFNLLCTKQGVTTAASQLLVNRMIPASYR